MKPANIKITRLGNVKVLDFGLATAMRNVAKGVAGSFTLDGKVLSLSRPDW